VNSCVSSLQQGKVVELFPSYFTSSFPSSESLEFPVVRFLVTCARETLINEWCSLMD
jgi:hypothetical protein